MNFATICMTIALLSVIGGASWYLGLRFWGLSREINFAFACIVLTVYGLLMATLVLRFALMNSTDSFFKQIVNTIGSYWMGIFLYLVLFFVLSDLVLLLLRFIKIENLDTFKPFVRLSGVVIAVSLIGYGVWNAYQLKVVEYTPDLSVEGGLNMVLISDLHLGAITSEKRMENIVDKVNELNPDVICIAGDFFDSDFSTIGDTTRAVELLRQLKAEYGVYCCLGNHDAGATFPQMELFLKDCGIKVLSEEAVTIDGRLTLAGRVDSSPIGSQGKHVRGDTEAFLNTLDKSLPIVVLDHNPINIGQYTGFDGLVLSGHTHHGQMWPANYVTAYGVYNRKNGLPQYIVTSGVGIWGMPVRVASNCEVVMLRFESTYMN